MRPFKKARWPGIKKKLKTIGKPFSKTVKKIVAFFCDLSGKARHRAVRAKMQKADIILASPRLKHLSPSALLYRLVLGNRYVHSMLYIGEDKIIHTTAKHGVVVNRLPRKIYRKDLYTILRVRDLDKAIQNQIVDTALEWRKKRLDHAGLVTNVPARLMGLRRPLWRWEKRRIWCSMLIYKSFLAAGITLVPREQSGNITSEDLLKSLQLEPVNKK